MGTIRRWLVVVVAAAAILALARLVLFRPKPTEVEVARVERGAVEETVSNARAGTVKARLRARLSPQLGGRVAELPHRKGARVTAGALLLRLDDSVQRAQVALGEENARSARARGEEACLAAELAGRELVRGKALEADGIASAQNLDALASARDRANAGCRAAAAGLAQAEAQVRLARAELALTEVRAPFAGVVADCSTEVGEWITPAPPGVPIPPVIDLLDTASLYVSAPIDEVDSERVAVGLDARVRLDSRPGEHVGGRVVRVAPFVADLLEQNRTVEVEAEFGDRNALRTLLPGTSADLEVILARREAVLRVPTSAIAEGGKVLVLAGGVLAERTITPGMRNWQFTEVRDGLVENDLVVTARGDVEIKAGARAVARSAK